jgi:hypothetical protein
MSQMNLTNRSIDKSINKSLPSPRRTNLSMSLNNKYQPNSSINAMNMSELNDGLNTPKIDCNYNFNSNTNKNNQNSIEKNNIHQQNIIKSESIKSNGRNSMLDKKYNFTKSNIEDKLSKNNLSSNRNS